MKVLFLGTPEFACPSLEMLAARGHEVVGVITRPDRPAGRGRRVQPSAVKRAAQALGLPVLQPPRVNAPEFLETLRGLEPTVLVVAAFGAILKRPLLTLAPLGSVNVHASLLPAYRGVAPVQWSLIHGQRTTGVTIMLMDEGVDTGPILSQRVVEILPLETAGEVLKRLAVVGAEALVETLDGLEKGTVRPVPQPESGASYAPRLTREHGYLDLGRDAQEVTNQFRGVTPAPGARVFHRDQAVLVSVLRPVPDRSGTPYTVLEVGRRHLRVAAAVGAVDLLRVRPPGKKDMEGAAFARGRGLVPGESLQAPPVIPDLAPRPAVVR